MNPVAHDTRSLASAGDTSAIASLINKAIRGKGITATVILEDGDLHVVLDAQRVPSQQAARFIVGGIKKLDIEPAFTVKIFGRIAGQPFATWHQKFELKPKPFGYSTPLSQQSDLPTDASSGVSIQMGGNIVQLDAGSSQTLGYIGIFILIVGIFAPMMSAPVVGTLSYFRNGSEEAIVLLVLSAFSVFCLKKEYYSWLYGPATWSFLLISFTFYYYHSLLSDTKSSINEELLGNPFRGLADAAMASTQLEWGWVLLFLGSGLVLLAAYQKRRRLDKQAFLSIGNVFAGAILLAIVDTAVLSVRVWAGAPKVNESEAKTYVGSINRGQQLSFLENDKFSDDIETIGLGIPTETNSYTYEIAISEDDMTVVHAVPLDKRRSSFTGAVFLVETEEGSTTESIICQSKGASRVAPDTPILSSSGGLSCSDDATEL